MLLTIALLTKNSEDTVGYALKSVLRQSVPSNIMLELVVVDGCSTDNTLKIVEEIIHKLYVKFSDQFVKHSILQEKIGIGYARNVALKEASGSWILWVDSDNILAQDYILKAIQEIELRKNTNIAVLYPHRVVTIRKSGNLAERLIICYDSISQTPLSKKLVGITGRLVRDDSIKKILPYTAMQGVVCKTKVLRDLGGFNPYLPAAEDVDVYLRILSHENSIQPFNSTLYCFTRKTLSAWFKQATMWGYGRELLMQFYGSNFSVQNQKAQWLFNRIADLMCNLIRYTLLIRRGISVCGVISLFIPLIYVYRRVGYIKGYLCALEQRRKITRRVISPWMKTDI